LPWTRITSGANRASSIAWVRIRADIAGRRPAHLDADIASLHPAQAGQPLPERRDQRLPRSIVLGKAGEHADPTQALPPAARSPSPAKLLRRTEA